MSKAKQVVIVADTDGKVDMDHEVAQLPPHVRPNPVAHDAMEACTTSLTRKFETAVAVPHPARKNYRAQACRPLAVQAGGARESGHSTEDSDISSDLDTEDEIARMTLEVCLNVCILRTLVTKFAHAVATPHPAATHGTQFKAPMRSGAASECDNCFCRPCLDSPCHLTYIYSSQPLCARALCFARLRRWVDCF